MVKVTLKDNKFSVKGTFDFGYIGLYKDDKFYIDIEEVILSSLDDYWDELSATFNIKDKSEEAISVKGMLIPEFMPDDEDNIYNDDVLDVLYSIESEIDEPNDGSVEKMDVEAAIRETFPMFNWDKFLSTIKPKVAGIDFHGNLYFECSDSCGLNILCCAVAELDEQFRFSGWDNF